MWIVFFHLFYLSFVCSIWRELLSVSCFLPYYNPSEGYSLTWSMTSHEQGFICHFVLETYSFRMIHPAGQRHMYKSNKNEQDIYSACSWATSNSTNSFLLLILYKYPCSHIVMRFREQWTAGQLITLKFSVEQWISSNNFMFHFVI